MKKLRTPSNKDIAKLVSGEIPHWMRELPLIILHYAIRMWGMDDVGWEWRLAYAPCKNEYPSDYLLPEGSVEVKREDAKKIMDTLNMSLAHKSAEGEVYEMPDQPFFRKYNNKKRK